MELVHKTLRKALRAARTRFPIDVIGDLSDAVLRLLLLEHMTVDGGLHRSATSLESLQKMFAIGEDAVRLLVRASRPGEAVRMERALRRLATAFFDSDGKEDDANDRIHREKAAFRPDERIWAVAEALVDALVQSPHLAVAENALQPERQEKLATGAFAPWPLPLRALQRLAVERILAPFASAHQFAIQGTTAGNATVDGGAATDTRPAADGAVQAMAGRLTKVGLAASGAQRGGRSRRKKDYDDEEAEEEAQQNDEEDVDENDEDEDEDEDEDDENDDEQPNTGDLDSEDEGESSTHVLHRVPATAVLKLCDLWHFELSPSEVELMELAYLAEMLDHEEFVEAAEYADGNVRLEQALTNLSGYSVASLIEVRRPREEWGMVWEGSSRAYAH